MVFKVPSGGANWIGVRFHIKLPQRTEMVVKTCPKLLALGPDCGEPQLQGQQGSDHAKLDL